MRAVVQRVSRARVVISGQEVATIGQGLLVLLGVGRQDGDQDADYLAAKIAGLRIFEDEAGKLNLSLAEVGGQMLVVSQFTLYGDCRKGRRPSFIEAAPPDMAARLYLHFVEAVKALSIPVATGRFQEMMEVELVNDGPVTLIVESKA